jgi:hypothetical protein
MHGLAFHSHLLECIAANYVEGISVPKFLDFLLRLLSQFAGGPGPMENNLVRFGLPAILWGALLIVAWSRQRQRELPREKLLVWGFGLGFGSQMLMAGFVALQMLQTADRLLAMASLHRRPDRRPPARDMGGMALSRAAGRPHVNRHPSLFEGPWMAP